MQSSAGYQPSLQLLTCEVCQQIYYKPVTLTCGHTFCKACVLHMKTYDTQRDPNTTQGTEKINKVPVCKNCESIIWRSTNEMSENLTIQQLIEKYYPEKLKTRARTGSEDMSRSDNMSLVGNISENNEQTEAEKYFNKILIRIEEPSKALPSPYCYSEFEFDITGQAKQLVITWPTLESKGLGLLGSILKIEPIAPISSFNKIIFEVSGSHDIKIPQERYRAYFLGISFVKMNQLGSVSVNMRKKFIILGETSLEKIMVDLEICDCQIFHAKNYNNISVSEFQNFFKFYDLLSNPHFMRQIYQLISDVPFNRRDSPQAMIYCALRVLRLPENLRKKLIYKFDDEERMDSINQWIFSKRESVVEDIFNVQVPGKYNSSMVFFMVLLLLAFHWFQNN